MVRVSFKCCDKGALVTFDAIAESEAVAIERAAGYCFAAGLTSLQMTLCRPYTPPQLCNFVTTRHDADGGVAVSVGGCRG